MATPAWLKKGAEANKAINTTNNNSSDVVRRFFIKPEESAFITFLDGELIEVDGEKCYDNFGAMEHSFMHNGEMANFICNKAVEGYCVLCDDKKFSTYHLLFTILDHRKVTGKNGTTYQNQKRLFTARRETVKLLMRKGSLVGKTFEVLRAGKKSPSEGQIFELQEANTLASIKSKYNLPNVDTIDYEKALTVKSNEQLITMGLGPVSSVPMADIEVLPSLKVTVVEEEDIVAELTDDEVVF
jgi:hypothetical protein